tara:strand:+ start:3256 stop:3543 length:288 start_codon:yes stop_codon:yes gene_type:complete
MRTKAVDGQVIELTAEENAQRDLEEQAWADEAFDRAITRLRIERNQRLAETDYRALSDQDLNQKWIEYRQALRDLTQDLETVEDVNTVVWPTEPE